MSWADVAKGKRPQHEDGNWLTFANESIPYQKWKGKSMVGKLQKVEYLKAVGKMKKQMGLRDDQVRYVGGLTILVTFDSEESLVNILTEKEDLWKRWCKYARKWNREQIPFQRIAWLRISGVPLQLWIDGVFNCVGERFGKVIKPSNADENDMNFNYDAVGVLVNHGSTINEKITIRWKHELFDVWVTEEHRFWTPNLCAEAEDGPELPVSIVNVNSEENTNLDNMDTDNPGDNQSSSEDGSRQESPEYEVTVPENEPTGQEDKEGSPTVGEGIPKNVNEVLEHEVFNEEREKQKDNGNSRDKEVNLGNATSGNNDVDTNEEITKITKLFGPSGLNEDKSGGLPRSTQNKRKRSSIMDCRTGSLKPNHNITKKKLPDLNLDLSDESRIRTKKRALDRRVKINKKRNKVKARIPEVDTNQLDQLGAGLDDDYESDWVEDSGQEEHGGLTVPESQEEVRHAEPIEIQKEINETLKVGMELGVELLQKEAMVKKVVTEDQVDVGQS
ncbi:hypothetical protein Hanom_Chr06g00576461 [Helianthus anomalus]